MEPTLLAFDSATERVSVALGHAGRVWTRDAAGGAMASATLLPAVHAVLAGAGLALRDVMGIAFGRGPGAFTGLRTACSVAQGLALGLPRPVVPVDTLLALAEDARDDAALAPGTAVWALLDARMDELYAACYLWDGTRWATVVAPLLARPETLTARWVAEPPEVVAGRALDVFAARLGLRGARSIPAAEPRGAALLRVARAAWADGGGVDAALALPLYVRDKVAQTTAEREAAR